MSAAPKSRETLAWCERAAVIPVLRIDDVESGVEIARALFEGGLPIIEITFRTAAAPAALAACARALPRAIFAAGSVRRPQQLRVAKDAGARFAVSPGWREDLSLADILPLLPGAATASDLLRADSDGFSFVKFFPAAAAGGVAALRAFAGPFADFRFCPTGGITAQNAVDYLSLPNVVCVGGSWLVDAGDSPTAIFEKAAAAAKLGAMIKQ